jgi:hypothetical protein
MVEVLEVPRIAMLRRPLLAGKVHRTLHRTVDSPLAKTVTSCPRSTSLGKLSDEQLVPP